jgi:hypothetical protein
VDINIEKKEGIDKNTRFEMIFKWRWNAEESVLYIDWHGQSVKENESRTEFP